MAFKLNGTTAGRETKFYLWRAADYGNGCSLWYYVSADAATTVDGCAYISNATADGVIALDMLKIGDVVMAYQVASITDTNTIQEDMKAGITDLSMHIVLDNTGAFIDLSDDVLAATVTYGD